MGVDFTDIVEVAEQTPCLSASMTGGWFSMLTDGELPDEI